MRRDSGSLIVAGIFFIISAVVVMYFYFTKDKISSTNDIGYISGPFEKYDWADKGGRNGSSLTFKLSDYSAEFKIKADFFSILDQGNFKLIPREKTLTIGVSKKKISTINTSQKPIFVYSVVSDDLIYLDIKKTIKRHNSNLFFLAAGLFAIGGTFLICLGQRAKVKSL